jgi:glycosyltransferase involved in cell wall biosynthesis
MIPHRLVSTIIPVHNREHLVGAAIESVVSQTVPPGWELELIVVDDGSTDGTMNVVERCLDHFQSDGGSASALSIPHSGYPGAVRNRGVEASRGELLAFLDSDDRWYPGKLAAQLTLHDAPRCRISHTREVWLREGRVVSQRKQRHRRQGDIFDDALQKCIVGPSTVVIERSLFDEGSGFREDLEIAEDYEYWLRILAAEEISFVDDALTEKRAGSWDQLSEKYGQIEAFRIAALRKLVVEGHFVHRGMPSRQQRAEETLARKLQIYAAGARKRGRRHEAERLEREAREYGPTL